MRNTSLPDFPTTRREFLRRAGAGVGLLAFSRFAPEFLVQSTLADTPLPEKDRTILVLVQLAGGNDGLNTVVPFEDANYYHLRPTLALPKAQLLPLNDTLALHPACAELHRLYGEGQLAIVQNVGYPNPNRSHFRSAEIWETASDSGEFSSTGWIGRFLDNACAGASDASDPVAIHATNGLPQTFSAQHEHPTFGLPPEFHAVRDSESRRLLEKLVTQESANHEHDNLGFLQHTLLDALVTEKRVQRVLADYRTASEYPGNAFAHSLRNVASLIAAGMSTRVYFVSLSGFDTHSNQLTQQANLLRTLSDGLAAFQRDLRAHGLDRQVMTVTFSEFGRRPSENQSKGTDHGTAAPLFVMGGRVRAGLQGTTPSLRLERNQDLAFTTDFRQVYASVLEDWLGCPATTVLGRRFERVPLVG